MKLKVLLFTLVVVCGPLSCGPMEGVELDVDPLQPENPIVEPSQTSSWPDAVDLGVVVSSEVVPLADPPPPLDLAR
jgi:hypothetical protein